MTIKADRSAKETVLARYPDACCIRTVFGKAIWSDAEGKRIGKEVRGAYWDEEVWIEAADELEGC